MSTLRQPDECCAARDRGGPLPILDMAGGDASVSPSPFRIHNDEVTVPGSMSVLNSFAPASPRRGGGIKLQVAPAA